MPREISQAGLNRRIRAEALGVTPNALAAREWRARRAIKATREAASPKPPPSAWIGLRIWPPLEADHPSRAEP